jgi:hypothetical protein
MGIAFTMRKTASLLTFYRDIGMLKYQLCEDTQISIRESAFRREILPSTSPSLTAVVTLYLTAP